LGLKEAGVDQALIDVIGDEETLRQVYHLDCGIEQIAASLERLQKAGLPLIPHIVCGLHFGQMRGERKAIEMLAAFDVEQLVVVSLMNLKDTPLAKTEPPAAEDVADVICEARLRLPNARISLGCARQRGNTRLETLALDAGVNRMALPSDEAVERAQYYGLEIKYQKTCCSVTQDISSASWKSP
jgi:uncharacterized radical SAM superfamily protein